MTSYPVPCLASADVIRFGTPTRTAWSPDEARLAFGTDQGAVVVVADGGKITVVKQPRTHLGTGDDRHRVRDLVWSPGGDYVAWTDSAAVYSARSDGSGVILRQQVGASPVIAWGPAFLAMGAPSTQRLYMFSRSDCQFWSRAISPLTGIASLAWQDDRLAIESTSGGQYLARVQGWRIVVDAL